MDQVDTERDEALQGRGIWDGVAGDQLLAKFRACVTWD